MQHRDLIIIGGGPAGRVVVHRLHESSKNLSVTLIKDEESNVNRCAIPYGVSSTKPLEKYLIPNKLVTDFGAELLVDSVESINLQKRSLQTAKGEKLSYDKLVLATGARPLLPPIPGVEASNCTTVRSKEDLEELRALKGDCKQAVVVGGGYIGIEVAVELMRQGIEVTVVEMLPHILLATTEPEFAEKIETHVQEQGLNIIGGEKVESFQTSAGKITAVELSSGRSLPADYVVISVGVRPNTELAEAAGLEVSHLGIVTDEHLMTSAPGVYAAGDCVQKKNFVSGQPSPGEFGTNAVFMSNVLSANLLGQKASFPGVINANASTAFELSFGSAGLTEKQAKEAGLDAVSGSSEVLDRYPMIDGATPIHTKLIFERSSERLLGGSVLRRGHCVATNIDLLSFAIQKHAKLEDLLQLQYATHPELAAKPSDNILVFAAKEAKRKLLA